MPEIIILHGLNNTSTAFLPLGEELKSHGYQVHYLSLMGHQELLLPQMNIPDSVAEIHKQLLTLPDDKEYIAIGFSQGGLTLQLALMDAPRKIIKQILLAPAIDVKFSFFYKFMMKLVPKTVKLLMNTPKEVRKYDAVYPAYYELVFSQIEFLENQPESKLSKIPTLMVMDPQDELIKMSGVADFAKKKSLPWEIKSFPRKVLDKRVVSKHHAIFHPNFHEPQDWKKFNSLLIDFLKTPPNL